MTRRISSIFSESLSLLTLWTGVSGAPSALNSQLTENRLGVSTRKWTPRLGSQEKDSSKGPQLLSRGARLTGTCAITSGESGEPKPYPSVQLTWRDQLSPEGRWSERIWNRNNHRYSERKKEVKSLYPCNRSSHYSSCL